MNYYVEYEMLQDTQMTLQLLVGLHISSDWTGQGLCKKMKHMLFGCENKCKFV